MSKQHVFLRERALVEETTMVERRVNCKGGCSQWGGLRAFYLVETRPGFYKARVVESSPEFWGKPTRAAKAWERAHVPSRFERVERTVNS